MLFRSRQPFARHRRIYALGILQRWSLTKRKHGITTPMLLPVINPNLRTIEPREMWEKYGIEALITNSYVIWKHEDLRTTALSDGIHSLLDFPGAVVTDSGTFQSYIYGDVEVGPEEIVAFQRKMCKFVDRCFTNEGADRFCL